jgi:hypothetical protein
MEQAEMYPARRAHRSRSAREDGIQQIIPVQGAWQALHMNDMAQYRHELLFALPVVAWALVREDGEDAMVGMEHRGGVLARCDESGDFLTDLAPGADPADHLDNAEYHWREYHRNPDPWHHEVPIENSVHILPLISEASAPERLRKPRKRPKTPPPAEDSSGE